MPKPSRPPPEPPVGVAEPLYGQPVGLSPAPLPVARAVDPFLGATVDGKFLIEADLGKGGAGRVYIATQLALHRRVALKILRPDLEADGDERFAERFFREASLAGALQHPNVVTVHDYGRSPEGLCYIAMELLDGRSLKDLMKDGPLEPERALGIFEQVGRGLRAAHRAGLVHRDVKPGNVLVVPGEDGAEVAKLLDFGLVKSDAAEVTEITRDGSFLGTPHYAAPEQVRGEEADARADIYAFGVMLFRALTGKLPYASKNAMAIALAHVRDPIPSMAERAPELTIAPELEDLVRRCMAKDPAARFQDMDSLLQAILRLRHEVGGLPRPLPPAPPVAPVAPAAPPPRPSAPLLLLVGGALAGLVGLGLAAVAFFSLRPVEGLVPPGPAADVAPLAVTAPVLAEDSVSVTVLTEPAGARVLADGVEVGTTPFVGPLDLVEGAPPPVRVELDGYAPAELRLEPGAGGLRAEQQLQPLAPPPAPAAAAAVAPAPAPAPVEAAAPRPQPAAAAPRPAPAPSPAPQPAAAPAPRPAPAGGGGAVVIDGVSFAGPQVAAALRFANSASKDELVAAGIAPAQAAYVLKARPYADLAAFGAAYGVGPKTVQAVARATAR